MGREAEPEEIGILPEVGKAYSRVRLPPCQVSSALIRSSADLDAREDCDVADPSAASVL